MNRFFTILITLIMLAPWILFLTGCATSQFTATPTGASPNVSAVLSGITQQIAAAQATGALPASSKLLTQAQTLAAAGQTLNSGQPLTLPQAASTLSSFSSGPKSQQYAALGAILLNGLMTLNQSGAPPVTTKDLQNQLLVQLPKALPSNPASP